MSGAAPAAGESCSTAAGPAENSRENTTPAPTPSRNSRLPFRTGGFATITEALDYAAQGETGYSFFGLDGRVTCSLPYREVRIQAVKLAAVLADRYRPGDRIAMVAETSPDFVTAFYACQYASLVPVPVPLPVNLGGKDGYIAQIRRMITGARATAAIAPRSLRGFLDEAVHGAGPVDVHDYSSLASSGTGSTQTVPFGPDGLCYIQYSSGSTSDPKGVIGTQSSVCSNLTALTRDGLECREGDRGTSWLPMYHDMGLIGFLLSPMFAQLSTDLISTSDFIRKPLLWLRIMTGQGGTITYSPSFGYDLVAKRSLRTGPGTIDLSGLRIAGIGGDMVRMKALDRFTEAFSGCGFDRKAFVPSYGMAEATLAVSFPDPGSGPACDSVDMRHLTRSGIAQPATALTPEEHTRKFVLCGRALPGHSITVRNEDGHETPDRTVGRIFIKGPSLTPGYFSNAAASSALYAGDWLDTGDMGYFLDGQIVITGRAKDLIIVNGRNIWPQDIEWAVDRLEGIRSGGVAAFSVDDGNGERIVVVAERRGMDGDALARLQREVSGTIHNAVGICAEVILARPHSMVLTSSGKLSRQKVRKKYLDGCFDVFRTVDATVANA